MKYLYHKKYGKLNFKNNSTSIISELISNFLNIEKCNYKIFNNSVYVIFVYFKDNNYVYGLYLNKNQLKQYTLKNYINFLITKNIFIKEE